MKTSRPSTGSTSRPLRILFTLPTPWIETLGTPKVSIEISRQLTARGHRCEVFSLDQALKEGASPNRHFKLAQFQWALLRHIRREGPNYDVIQAEHNTIPFPRGAYGFAGLIISKSNGLFHFYQNFKRNSVCGGSRLARIRRHASLTLKDMSMQGKPGVERGFRSANIVHVLNQTERDFVSGLGYGEKTIVIPNGLSWPDRADPADAVHRTLARGQTIAFIGSWSQRKGSRQLPAIVRNLRALEPSARFLMLGTGLGAKTLLPHFSERDRNSITIVPRYEASELPALLSHASIGLFPSFLEGFGLGALEMLAAGLPIVCWDVPGPRDFVKDYPLAGELVPAGNVDQTVEALRRLMLDTTPERRRAATGSASQFRWPEIAMRWEESVMRELR